VIIQEERVQTPKQLGWVLAILLVFSATASAQTVNGAITGVVKDASGAVVKDVALTLRNMVTDQVVGTTMSGQSGEYAFRNLAPAKYAVDALKDGFQQVSHPDIEVTLSSVQRVEITLPIGTQTQRVEVVGGSSVLSVTGTQEHGISPETLQQLPLLMNSGPRAAAGFAILMPGVSTGGGANAFDARINGGLQSGDEASVDGVSMQQGFMSQGGMVSIFQDFPMSPDMVSEVKILTSNFAPEYGSSTSGQIMAVTKSGGSSFHGSAFEFYRNDFLKAKQWGLIGDKAPFNRKNYGVNIGGPAKVPGLSTDKWKSYFYFDYEGYRQTGGSNQPTLSIPSLKERSGDFTDWRDPSGNLIPIYDPLTIRPDGRGGYTKDQFMGCDGNSPNVICPSRIKALVRPWLAALPSPTASGPLNNYLGPAIPDTILGNSDYYMGRYDVQAGSNNHMFVSIWHQRAPAKFVSVLPQLIASESFSDPQNSWVNRFNYDRIFTSSLLNHMSMGYLNRNEGYGCVNQDFVNDFPKIAGVAGYRVPPEITFSDGFARFGCSGGPPHDNITTRPTFIVNDAVTWATSAHSIKIGMEWRKIMGNLHANGNEAGSFNFGKGATGLVGINSGNPVASFLIGAVDSGSATFRSVNSTYPRQHAWIVHAGDTWRVNDKFTFDYGMRWDYYSPSSEKNDVFSFFDPNGANPGAGGRLGRLAFAGDGYGAASYGKRYPEKDWYGGFAPRLGAVYSLNQKTVVRSGWGIFYTQAFYPGWGGGMSQDGFSTTPSFNTTLGGIQPAFFLDQGLPQNFERPPIVRSDYRNGQDLVYRPVDGNKRPYAHQWNITVDRELGRNLSLSTAYVGSAGRRLPSSIDPINAIDPKYLSMGTALYDEFKPGDTSLHGVPLPYAGWVQQMTGCAPSVAQALRPYPQYCSELTGLNENHGSSHYNSLQMKLEKRFSGGTYALVSYTLSKTISSGSDNTQRAAGTWSGLQGVISPFEKGRNEVIAATDTPHVLSAAFVYELPVGKGRKYMNQGGASNALIGGWQLSTIFRYSSGLPMYFRSSFCNVPGQFRAGCIPAITNAASVFAQDTGSFDPAKGPLFNKGAFESVDAFNFYYGKGNRIEESVRTFGYHNQDLSFIKNTRLAGTTNVQIRFEIFNLWNWHMFSNPGEWGGLAFNNDLSSPDFGKWNGSVTEARTMQIAARFEF
jgi:hypothetical protein